MAHALKIFAANAGGEQARMMCESLGIPLGRVLVKKFANDETNVSMSDSVRDGDVYVIQSGHSHVASPNDLCVGRFVLRVGAASLTP